MLDYAFWRDRRVLVTGHTGFKGSWLTLLLCSLGANVWGYSLPPEPGRALFTEIDFRNRAGNPKWGHFYNHAGDLRDLDALKIFAKLAQPQVVLHLAAQSLVRRSYQDPLGTWSTNVNGSLCLLEALKPLDIPCAVVMVTTDKVYSNREWVYGYREEDTLGGYDPYSSSKAAAELGIASWRASFCGSGPNQTSKLAIATARAGNVIGGGDWAEDRIVPDAIRALAAGEVIGVRNPNSTRPWQHVLEPLVGYLMLAQKLTEAQANSLDTGNVAANPYACAFNFGPALEANRSVRDLVNTSLGYWPGRWVDLSDSQGPHEAGKLHLQIDKAHHLLGWHPRWSFFTTVERTVQWYKAVHEGASATSSCLTDLEAYLSRQSVPEL
jgi:CDP-glucose 4,6-dehydratase